MKEMVLQAKLPEEVGLPAAGFPDGWYNEVVWK